MSSISGPSMVMACHVLSNLYRWRLEDIRLAVPASLYMLTVHLHCETQQPPSPLDLVGSPTLSPLGSLDPVPDLLCQADPVAVELVLAVDQLVLVAGGGAQEVDQQLVVDWHIKHSSTAKLPGQRSTSVIGGAARGEDTADGRHVPTASRDTSEVEERASATGQTNRRRKGTGRQ